MRFLAPLLFLSVLVVSLVSGCGGGGGGATGAVVQTATPAITVQWPTRTKDLAGPSSALSVSITLHSATKSQPDLVVKADRNSNLAAHAETYTFGSKGLVGAYTFTASFYSQATEGGVVTATAAANVNVTATGGVTGPLATIVFTPVTQHVSVVVATGQTVSVGASTQIVASADDGHGDTLALSPGSFQFSVPSGTTAATITPDGIITGVNVGQASVTATVDGISSQATPVQVAPTQTTPSVLVDWPARTRDLMGPSSALSVKIVLHSIDGLNPDIEIVGNRSSNLAAHTDTFPASGQDGIGQYSLVATFYSDVSEGGVVTATAAATGIQLSASGTIAASITFNAVISSITVPLQGAPALIPIQLLANATDSSGNIVAVTPGSFTWAFAGAATGSTLTPDGIIVISIASTFVGPVSVSATADGVTGTGIVVGS